MAEQGLNYIFLGPTAPNFSNPCYVILPPAKRGDVLKLLNTNPNLIVLVDGYFGQEAAVMHRELLEAIETGTTVIGCSSMGALRAAELNRYGMHGCGVIFESFHSRQVETDDDVALLHAPKELRYSPITLPLCNLRATVARLMCIRPRLKSELQEVMQFSSSLPYSDRTLKRIQRHLSERFGLLTSSKVIHLLNCAWVDQKRLDFDYTLSQISTFEKSDSPNFGKLPETTWLTYHRMQTCTVEPEVPESVFEAVVRFYDPSYSDLIEQCFLDLLFNRFELEILCKDTLKDASLCPGRTSMQALAVYRQRWPKANLYDAAGAAVQLRPNATARDWMNTPPSPISRSSVQRWAFLNPQAVRAAFEAYRASNRYDLAICVSRTINTLSVSLQTDRPSIRPMNFSETFLLKSLLLARGGPAADVDKLCSVLGFGSYEEMIDLYRHIVLFESLYEFHNCQPWGVDGTRSYDCLELMQLLIVTRHEKIKSIFTVENT